METEEKHVHPQHKVLSIYNRHILADHLALKRDYERLCGHARCEQKFDESKPLSSLAETARKRGCDTVAFWETRRRKDLFLYLAAAPEGPTIKFHVHSIKSSSCLRFEGNFALRTRPVLGFSQEFGSEMPLRVARELLKRTFATPYLSAQMAPFIDHEFQFIVQDPKQLLFEFRAYAFDFDQKDALTVKESGPYFAAVPVSIYSGFLGGDEVWRNENYLTFKEVRMGERAELDQKKQRIEEEKDWRKQRDEREFREEDPINAAFSEKAFAEAFK